MDDNLVGYVLNALDTDTHQQVEKYLSSHPDAQRRLENIRQALQPLAVDCDTVEPPPGLAHRTIGQVAEYRCRPTREPVRTPAASGLGHERRWWRRADLLVAASIFLTFGGLSVQSVAQYRSNYARLACANNLREFHQALATFSDRHDGAYPGVPLKARDNGAEPPEPWTNDPRYNVAGIFVPELHQAGCLGPKVSVRCPANGAPVAPVYSLENMRYMPPDEFDQTCGRLAGCYAYSLGYRDALGEHRGMRRDASMYVNDMPIMADKPTVLDGGGRSSSPNHKGGQNVLFVGGYVRFCPTPNVGIDGDDIYLNKDGKVGAGIGRFDTCLGTSLDRP